MKRSLLVWILIFFTTTVYSQHRITGVVKDRDNKPVPFVMLTLVSEADAASVKQTIADTAGTFAFANLKKGDYRIISSTLLYDSVIIRLHVDSANPNPVDIQLTKERSTTLQGVQVTSRKEIITQKFDRLVVNVKGTAIGISGSALEVLQRLPGVDISADGTAITLNGKSQVGILINNKITRVPISALLQMLSSTNAKDIEKIELLSNPPAQYDAEFTGGLINIQQVKNDYDGTNASILLGVGYGWRDKEKAGINWNMRRGKVNFYGDLNYDRNNNPRKFNYRSNSMDSLGSYTNYSATDRHPVITGYTGRAGMDISVNRRMTIGFLVNGNLNLFKQHVTGLSENEGPAGPARIGLLNNEDSRRSLIVANANLNFKVDSSQTINVDIDHLNFYSKAPNDYINTYMKADGVMDSMNVFSIFKKTPVSVWAGKGDYSKIINSQLTLNTGIKMTHSILKNTVDAEHLKEGNMVRFDDFSEVSDMTENILALYAALDWNVDKKTRVNMGLRYEYSRQELKIQRQGTSLDNSMGRLFPTLYLSREITKQTTLQLSYGRRISRPTYNDLAPYVSFLDPNTYYIGNISLKPSFSDNLSATLKIRKYLIIAELNREKNTIVQSQPVFLEDAKQQIITALNLDRLLVSSLALNIPVKVTKWWDMSANVRALYMDQDLNDESNTNLFYVLKATQDLHFTNDISAQLFVSYNSSRIYGKSRIDGYQRTSFSLTKKVKNWNSSFQLSFNDIFGRYYNFQSINNASRFYKEYDEFEPRVVRLTYTHDLGNMRVKKERKRETSSDEVRNRF